MVKNFSGFETRSKSNLDRQIVIPLFMFDRCRNVVNEYLAILVLHYQLIGELILQLCIFGIVLLKALLKPLVH